MTLTCITGRSGSGKTTRCMDIIRSAMAQGTRVILLVPEQDTVQAELMLAREMQLQVLWNVEVLSPTRLARRVQEMSGGSARIRLSDAGRAMALRGVMLKLRSSLRYFKGGSQGAADRMGDFLVELKRGESDATALRLAADHLPAQGALAQKLYDLAAIYEAYDEQMAGKYIDGEDALKACAEQIALCGELKDAVIVADGFDVLPRTTLRLLAALGKQCRAVYVTFSMCEKGASDSALYEQSLLSLSTLAEMCVEYGVAVKWENLPARPLENPEIDHLARNLFANRAIKYDQAPEHIHIVQMRDPYMEAERAAGYLFEKCRKEGFRYRDMAVVCNDMDTYAERLRQAFARRGMRVYIDRAPTADTHPAAQYLLAALTGAARYYRMDDMLRCLKTGYSGLSLREADRLELYAMEHGLEGRLWEMPIEREEKDADGSIRTMEECRARFAAPIIRFRSGGSTRTARAFATSLVQLMEDAGIADQLARAHKACEDAEDLVGMQVLRQAQDAVNSVLDQAVELCGEEEMHIEDFIKLLRAGLQAVTLGSIPMSPDAVYVGEITRFKGRDVKLLYVVGANADVIPSRKQDNGLLVENEKVTLRAAARQAGAEVRINLLSNRTAVERFAIFGALISPKTELVLSWSSVDPRGAAKRESPLLIRLREKVFPLLATEGGATGDGYVYAGARASMREGLAAGLRAQMNGAQTQEELPRLAAAYRAAFPEDYAELVRTLTYNAAQQEIDDETAQELYARWKKQRAYGVDELVASISQLETFAMCPFAHYMSYGLRPKELKEPDMDVRDRGTMEHKAVELFMGRLAQLHEINDEEAEALMDEVLQPLFDEDADKRRRHSGLVRAGHSQIRRTMQRVGRLLAMQQRLSSFEIGGEEIVFVPGDLPPLELRDGKRVHLEGKIDRVDVKKLEGGEYARVIDYKTGSNALRLEDVYYGLRLQLFLYLDAVLSLRGAKPAGVFYQKLGDAPVALEGGRIDDRTEEKRNKKLRLTGYILEDEDVISSMCGDPDWMDQMLPIAPKRSKGKPLPGQYTETSREKLLSEEDFGLLRRHTRRKLTDLAQGILDGRAEVSPAQTAGVEACKFCRFRSVCGFEDNMSGCKKREYHMEERDVLRAIREEDDHA